LSSPSVLMGEGAAAPAGAVPAGCRDAGCWAIAEEDNQAKLGATAIKSPAYVNFLMADSLSIGAYRMSFLDIRQAE
jgi:hypothetical protein